jgi:ABC-type antimicrobial peptide transport system permease subunit
MSPELLGQLGLAAGAAVASGLRLYATVAVLGFLHRMGVLTLPSGLDVLAQTPVIVVAACLYLVEFVADKVPVVDSIWDAVHTFVRIPAAALLGFAALTDLQEPWRLIAALLCGTFALSAHGLKASTRVAVNTSPEPVSNWLASFAEDFAVFVILWLAIQHPWIAIAIAIAVVIAAILAAALIVSALRRLFRRAPKESLQTRN